MKQLKQRNTEQIYDSENVCICQISKPHNFLEFEFVNYAEERTHLKEFKEANKDEIKDRAKQLGTNGKTQREIRDELGISLGAANILKVEDGRVHSVHSFYHEHYE